MSIERKGQFLITEELGVTPSLGIESSQLRECISEIKERKFKGVFGAPYFGFREQNLDFLREIPWLTQIWFFDIDLKNIDAVYSLDDLTYFGVHPKRPPVDFSRFHKLETLVWIFKSKDKNIATLNSLKTLHIWHHNPKEKTFKGLELPPNLEVLEINWANADSVLDLPFLPKLKRIEFHRCRNLTSVAGLTSIAPKLEEIFITTSSKVSDDAKLLSLPSLKRAIINDKEIRNRH